MNLVSSRALFLLILVLSCTRKTWSAQNATPYSAYQKPTTAPHQVTEIIPTPATTSEIQTNSQCNHTEIALLVVKRSLRFYPSDICGGILVSARIVITAAHCFYDPHGFYRKYPQMFRVVFGRSGVYQNVAMVGPLAELIVAHPNYNEIERIDDIGAIRLKDQMPVGSAVIAGRLLPLAQKWWNDKEPQLEMLAFSVEDEDYQTVTTDRMAAKWQSKYHCEEAYHRWGVHIRSNQLCIELEDPQFYHRGESAILLLNGQPIGVLSFKFDVTSTANSLPYIYTELSRYTEFIQKEIHTDAALRLRPYRICTSILYVVISIGVIK